jgi:hypothetical protein
LLRFLTLIPILGDNPNHIILSDLARAPTLQES